MSDWLHRTYGYLKGCVDQWQLVMLPFLLLLVYEGVITLSFGPAVALQSLGYEVAWCMFTVLLWAIAVSESGNDLRTGGRARVPDGQEGQELQKRQRGRAELALVIQLVLFAGCAGWAGGSGPPDLESLWSWSVVEAVARPVLVVFVGGTFLSFPFVD